VRHRLQENNELSRSSLMVGCGRNDHKSLKEVSKKKQGPWVPKVNVTLDYVDHHSAADKARDNMPVVEE